MPSTTSAARSRSTRSSAPSTSILRTSPPSATKTARTPLWRGRDSGETFAWSGNVSVNPPRFRRRFPSGRPQIPQILHYAHDYARFDSGRHCSMLPPIIIMIPPPTRSTSRSPTPSSHLTHLELKSPDNGETIIAIPSFVITDTDASVARQHRAGRPDQILRRLAPRPAGNGRRHQFAFPARSCQPTRRRPKSTLHQRAASPAETPWRAHIDDIAFDDYTLLLEDKSPRPPRGVSTLTSSALI